MPQNEYIEVHRKRYGRRPDTEERARKRSGRLKKREGAMDHKSFGLRSILRHKEKYNEKAQMRKRMAVQAKREAASKIDDGPKPGALPAYLLDRQMIARSKTLANMLKQKRKERAGKWDVPIQKVRPISQEEIFKVIRTGVRKRKAWKRMITKATFVPDNFVRAPPKYERMIRPSALRFKRANITHPELKVTLPLDIIGVKKNPQSPLYTNLGVITKGTIIEVNVAELGLVTQTGKVIWGKFAQVTNNPENDGCINGLLLI